MPHSHEIDAHYSSNLFMSFKPIFRPLIVDALIYCCWKSIEVVVEFILSYKSVFHRKVFGKILAVVKSR